MRPHQQFSEIKKIFADGKHRTNTHDAKELHTVYQMLAKTISNNKYLTNVLCYTNHTLAGY